MEKEVSLDVKKEIEYQGAKSWIKLGVFLYLFIFSIELIKRSSIYLGPDIKNLVSSGLSPLKAISVGWFSTSIVQSSSAVSSIAAAFSGNNILTLQTAVFIIAGASIGTTITALIISFVTGARMRRDFRHGFEIGLCYAIYSVLLVVVVFILEHYLRLFSRLSMGIAGFLQPKISFFNVPDIVGSVTSPIIDFLFILNKIFLLVFAFALLVFTLKYIGRLIIEVLGGEKKAKGFVKKHFDSKYRVYFIGVLLTAIFLSSSITIGLLVPLAVARLINLKKAIPFILGADVGAFTNVFFASMVMGNANSLAVAIAYMLFGVLGGLIFLPNTNFLFVITKYTSKRLIHISRRKALYVLIAFILIPLGIIVFF